MKNILEVNNLHKSYGQQIILEKINFEIKPGEIIGLIGRNGAGKTTLMKSILGLISIDQGEILYEGDNDYHQKKEKMNTIGYLLDCRLFEYMNAYDNLYIQEQYNNTKLSKSNLNKKIYEVLEFVELENNKKKVSEYSFGMKQRLGLALALLGDTKLLILDEPFVGLDPLGVKKFCEFIYKLSNEKGVAILISSHQLSEIENICEKYFFISQGTLRKHNDQSNKKYKITVDACTDEFEKQVGEMWKEIIIKENRFIILENTENNLNAVIQFMCQEKMEIMDIEISKSQISDLFVKGEI